MQRLSISEIITKIKNEETFEAVAEDYSFTLKIDQYVPYVCGAVHDGHQFRKELWANCLHTEYERWFEEDPCTKEFVKTHPIVIAGCDSRFEYDLNRAPENAIYEDAWGKQLWKEPLNPIHHKTSLEKHAAFYNVVHALIETLEAKFGTLVVYDMHSYNWRRWDREVPVINLGTANIDNERFGTSVEAWRQSLSELELPYHIEATSKINDTFQGNGYFLKYITDTFKNTLVLATEFKKIYCDELRQVIYPEVVHAIEQQLQEKLKAHAAHFYKTYKP
ncbi:N-formylglutamate amidohydrolase [Marinirhabdus gelatinilytica]|uniref:N-formylglutamate amidohydrolase n=1 Tax=Marinirhabdus gelatinilytica TaxID=1703343 RepID=A0A370Q583_9FLAO|nr:N-formylglutamate amidohydrolase [Marinirhabdus gelatinilytica]RDK83526.1 N-formylglutamate amidohydrolase [Marinirhabdus gelatinilytica]